MFNHNIVIKIICVYPMHKNSSDLFHVYFLRSYRMKEEEGLEGQRTWRHKFEQHHKTAAQKRSSVSSKLNNLEPNITPVMLDTTR